MIHFGVFLAQVPDIHIPVPPVDMIGAMVAVVLTFLLTATTYLMKRSLDTLQQIERRVNRHDTSLELHDLRLLTLETERK
jgi:hypothetical protein